MANDPTMPPSEQAATTPTNASPTMAGSPDMGAPSPAPQGGGEGSVMVNMPKAAFDAIHQLVTQLAQGLDQLKQGVEAQAQQGAGAAFAGPQAPAGPEAPSAPSPEAVQEPDEDDTFLKGVAEEGNKR